MSTTVPHDVVFTQESTLDGRRLERYRWLCLTCQVNGNDRHVHSSLADAQLCAAHHIA